MKASDGVAGGIADARESCLLHDLTADHPKGIEMTKKTNNDITASSSTKKELSIADLQNVRGAVADDGGDTKSDWSEDACCCRSQTETKCGVAML